MRSAWRKRIYATAIFTLVAAMVAWVIRDSLYYLDGWVLFASIAAAPMLYLIGYYRWDNAHPDAEAHWKKGWAASFTTVIALATAWLVVSVLFIPVYALFTPINNVRKYDFVVGKWCSSGTAHFPRPIPRDAQATRFHYCPGAMQAPAVLELAYTTTPEQIDSLYLEYARRSTLAFAAGSQEHYIEPTDYTDRPESGVDFSRDYTLFYLEEKPPTVEKDWNHPQSHGVAISKERCRIVYWAWSG